MIRKRRAKLPEMKAAETNRSAEDARVAVEGVSKKFALRKRKKKIQQVEGKSYADILKDIPTVPRNKAENKKMFTAWCCVKN